MSWTSLPERLDEVARRWGDHGLHFVERRQAVSYRELAQRVRRCAAALARAGYAPGDNLGLLLPTSAEFYVALLGAQRAGLAPSPFAPPANASRLTEDLRATARALRSGGCRALIVDGAMATRLGQGLTDLGVAILRIEELEGAELDGVEPAAPPSSETLALVQYTSGSTSHPKGVALTHAQLAAGIAAIVDGIALTAADVNGQWLPVHHDMGLIGSLAGIAMGVEQHLWSPMTFVRNPARWLAQFAARKATIYAGPNFSYAELSAQVPDAQLAELDLSSWRVAFNGAEPVDAAVLRRFTERFARCGLRPDVIMPVYGLAEITLAATFPSRGQAWRSRTLDAAALGPGAAVVAARAATATARELVSVGAAVAGHQVRIRHEGDTLPDGRIGEIQLRGPAVMAGYFHDPDASAEAFDAGWLRTGDLGFLAEGELFVTGRLKEMMILHGRNYYPHDVEAVMQEVPGCHRGTAVAFAGCDRAGEHMVVVAETRLTEPSACAALAEASQRAVRAALAIPRIEIVLVRPGAVPKTTSGKRQRLLVKHKLNSLDLTDAVVWSTNLPPPTPGPLYE